MNDNQNVNQKLTIFKQRKGFSKLSITISLLAISDGLNEVKSLVKANNEKELNVNYWSCGKLLVYMSSKAVLGVFGYNQASLNRLCYWAGLKERDYRGLQEVILALEKARFIKPVNKRRNKTDYNGYYRLNEAYLQIMNKIESGEPYEIRIIKE